MKKGERSDPFLPPLPSVKEVEHLSKAQKICEALTHVKDNQDKLDQLVAALRNNPGAPAADNSIDLSLVGTLDTLPEELNTIAARLNEQIEELTASLF
jgi:hypothetical protein